MTECWKGIIKWTRSESWVFNWIFNPFKKVNLNIFFSPVEQIFYHFRKANSDISKGWMIIMMINWLKLVPVSEKSSHIFFNLKDDSVWSITLGSANKNTLGKGPMLYFRFVGGDLHSFKIWLELKFWKNNKPCYKDFNKKKVFEIGFQERKFMFL